MPCPDCGSDATEYVAEVSAEICTACGTLLQSATDDLVDISEAQRFDEGRAFVNNSIFVGEGTKGHSSRFQSVSSCVFEIHVVAADGLCRVNATKLFNNFARACNRRDLPHAPAICSTVL